MPTPAKALSAMSKNLTRDEIDARLAAEMSVSPERDHVTLVRPKWLTGKGRAYWESILARMVDSAILDDLDAEMLAIYCSQLAERDALQSDLRDARKLRDTDLILAITKQLNAKDAKIRDFANDLGCTPTGRVRLAQRRAANDDGGADPNGDLFG